MKRFSKPTLNWHLLEEKGLAMAFQTLRTLHCSVMYTSLHVRLRVWAKTQSFLWGRDKSANFEANQPHPVFVFWRSCYYHPFHTSPSWYLSLKSSFPVALLKFTRKVCIFLRNQDSLLNQKDGFFGYCIGGFGFWHWKSDWTGGGFLPFHLFRAQESEGNKLC